MFSRMYLCSGLAGALLVVLAVQSASAVTIESEFNAGLEGWTGSSGGAVAFIAAGGNPGGFLQQTDVELDDMFVIAPASYLGDRTSFLNGTLSFDSIQVSGAGEQYAPFGTVTLRNGGNSVVADIAAPGNPPRDWAHFSVNLDAASFGATPASFSAILSNVTAIEVLLESQIGVIEATGMDNFRLTTVVPEPSTLVIGGAGILGAFLSRRRRHAGSSF